MYLFGGEGDGERLNDLWALSTITSRWRQYPSMPQGRTDHAFAWSEGSLWILGGYDARSGQDSCLGEDCRSDFVSYNLNLLQWQTQPASGSKKTHGGTLLQVAGELLLFFGTNEAGTQCQTADAHLLEVLENQELRTSSENAICTVSP